MINPNRSNNDKANYYYPAALKTRKTEYHQIPISTNQYYYSYPRGRDESILYTLSALKPLIGPRISRPYYFSLSKKNSLI
jgi:hypothetical protein